MLKINIYRTSKIFIHIAEITPMLQLL